MSTKEYAVCSGKHPRRLCPVGFKTDLSSGKLTYGGPPTAVKDYQVEDGTAWIIVDGMDADTTRTYTLQASERPPDSTPCVEVDEQEKRLTFRVNNVPALDYHFANEKTKRPYFHPVVGPSHLNMTRAWPVSEHGTDDEEHDHPHHTSMWVAHGRVNECDHWAAVEETGLQIHERFTSVISGNVFGGFVEDLTWYTPDRRPLMEEQRSIRLWNTPLEFRIIDLTIEFRATSGDVVFGDTKEGGICAIRVAEPVKGSRDGCITNAYGGIGESECWGKRSPWVDYSGILCGHRVGISVMDHPMNPMYPTYWHVRDYGLFAANPFGLSYYKSSYRTNGDWLLETGSSAAFRYRVVLHAGDAADAGIADRYHDWITLPVVRS